jgi:hypothetical protein
MPLSWTKVRSKFKVPLRVVGWCLWRSLQRRTQKCQRLKQQRDAARQDVARQDAKIARQQEQLGKLQDRLRTLELEARGHGRRLRSTGRALRAAARRAVRRRGGITRGRGKPEKKALQHDRGARLQAQGGHLSEVAVGTRFAICRAQRRDGQSAVGDPTNGVTLQPSEVDFGSGSGGR